MNLLLTLVIVLLIIFIIYKILSYLLKQNIVNKKEYFDDKKSIIILYSDGGDYFKFYEQIFRNLLYPKHINFTNDSSVTPDIVFTSVFGSNYKNYPNSIKILFNGEPHFSINNYNDIDLFISTINNIENENNIYYPFYAVSFGERFLHRSHDLIKRQRIIDDIRKNNTKTKFCGFLYSHSVQQRDKLFDIISNYKKVDALGSYKNTDEKFVSDRWIYTPTLTYNDIAVFKYKPYKFIIIGENVDAYGIFPTGYITEKITSAMLANSIPIYIGSSDVEQHFNPESMIIVKDLNNIDKVLDQIKELDENDDLYFEKLSKPWFKDNVLNEYFSTDYLIDKIMNSNISNKILQLKTL